MLLRDTLLLNFLSTNPVEMDYTQTIVISFRHSVLIVNIILMNLLFTTAAYVQSENSISTKLLYNTPTKCNDVLTK